MFFSVQDKAILNHRLTINRFDEYVRYVGDEVAVVAAVNEEIALEALKLIKVEYEVLEPILDFEKSYENKLSSIQKMASLKCSRLVLSQKRMLLLPMRCMLTMSMKFSKKCDYIVEETFYSQAQAHAMLEPHACNARLDAHNRLVIYLTNQTPYHVRRIIAKTLGLPTEKIRVIKPRVGGGFGGKQAFHGEMFASLVTLRTNKPSKCVFTREEVFGSSYTRHPMRITMKIGATKDGKIRAIDCSALSDTGAYGEHSLTVFMIVGSKVLPLYNKVDAVRFGGKVVYSNHVSAGAYRGLWRDSRQYALEATIDILAERWVLIPIKLREDNSMREKKTSPIFEIMGEEQKALQ